MLWAQIALLALASLCVLCGILATSILIAGDRDERLRHKVLVHWTQFVMYGTLAYFAGAFDLIF